MTIIVKNDDKSYRSGLFPKLDKARMEIANAARILWNLGKTESFPEDSGIDAGKFFDDLSDMLFMLDATTAPLMLKLRDYYVNR